jgi:glycosyltransferase involved in cell wall biosynthesis
VLAVGGRSSAIPVDEDLLRLVPDSVEVVRAWSPERLLFSTPVLRSVIWWPLQHVMAQRDSPWWFLARRRGEQLLRSRPFDVIYSRASPHVSNIVGKMLHQEGGPRWVAHFSDPWVDNPYLRLAPSMSRCCQRLEEAVIRESDAVTFTTTQTAELVMRKYPAAWSGKVHVIPHGYDTEALTLLGIAPRRHRRMRLVHTGNLYGDRSAVPFLEAIRQLNDAGALRGQLQVVFVGEMGKAEKRAVRERGLDEIVEIQGRRSFAEALQAAADADVLLVIDAPSSETSVFLPSKLVDYLMFRKPILGLTPAAGGSADLLRRLDYPVVPPDDVNVIARAVSCLVESWRAGRLEPSPAHQRIAPEYDIRQTTVDLEGILAPTAE